MANVHFFILIDLFTCIRDGSASRKCTSSAMAASDTQALSCSPILRLAPEQDSLARAGSAARPRGPRWERVQRKAESQRESRQVDRHRAASSLRNVEQS